MLRRDGMENGNVLWRPQEKQVAFMERTEDEVLYGGAAGGGKSDALVIEPLRQVHIPHYRALLLRKSFPQLSALIDNHINFFLIISSSYCLDKCIGIRNCCWLWSCY